MREVSSIKWRQLILVAVVAVVFGAGAGYLGAYFQSQADEPDRLTPLSVTAQELPSMDILG